MSNDFENSQELYKNVTKAIPIEALAKFQELSDKLIECKKSLNNMLGIYKADRTASKLSTRGQRN